jgi:glycosyltransferase involved in cell wall biosynthesis
VVSEHVAAVSILVITQNHASFIDQCLDSVERQTSTAFDVIVIDNCSTDGTTERVRRWAERTRRHVRVIVNPRSRGMCDNRNQFLRESRGDLVTSLSGDDYYEPDRIARQLAFFRTLPDPVAVVFGQSRVVSEEGREVGVWFDGWPRVPEGRVFGELIHNNFVSAATSMMRRSAIEAVGGYDERLFYEDYDMFLRLADRYEFRYLPGIVTNYRLSAAGASRAPEHIARMSDATARLLLKWHGGGRPYDRVIERRARSYAWRAFGADQAVGVGTLRTICEARPSFLNRASMAVATLRGVHGLVSRAQHLVRHVKTRQRQRSAEKGRPTFP